MQKLKKLKEKRGSLIEEMRSLNEERSFDKFKEKEVELQQLDDEIHAEERMLELTDLKPVEKDVETRDYNAEIRSAIANDKELDITNFEVRAAMGTPGVDGANGTSIGNIAKTTFAKEIIRKLASTSDLYKYVRKENLGSALHQIPVQKDKITRFSNVKELAEYAEQSIDFEAIQLAAHKYGNISVISEEAIKDTGYDIVAQLREQYGEGAAETLDYLIVKGDATTGIQGLESFGGTTGSHELVTGTAATVTFDEIKKLYTTLPAKYRKNATWVLSQELADQLSFEVDGIGRPHLTTDFSQVPFGGKPTPMLLGRPVVITENVAAITGAQTNDKLAFFGDLSRAMVVGVRESFTIKTSSEYAFIRDGLALKGMMRLDIKRALNEAMAILKSA